MAKIKLTPNGVPSSPHAAVDMGWVDSWKRFVEDRYVFITLNKYCNDEPVRMLGKIVKVNYKKPFKELIIEITWFNQLKLSDVLEKYKKASVNLESIGNDYFGIITGNVDGCIELIEL